MTKSELSFAVLVLSGAVVQAATVTPAPALESIVAHMASALTENRSHLRAYQVTRNYKLFGKERQKTKSEVNADITFLPPGVDQYLIHKVEGLGLGEVIVRKILENESELLADPSASEISMANYNFRLIREATLKGRPCYVLAIQPLRKDVRLLRGLIWVDAISYLIHRVEGEPAKTPSWWVHDIHIVLDFQDVDGMWLQTSLVSTANVRLLGQHTMVAHDVEYRLSGLEAGIIKVVSPGDE